MIDDFIQPPSNQPSKLDPDRMVRPRFDNVDTTSTPETISVKIERPAPAFRTPEQVAADNSAPFVGAAVPDGVADAPNDIVESIDPDELLLPEHATAAKKSRFSLSGTVKLFRKWEVSKKKLVIASVIAVVVLIGSGAAFALTRSHPVPIKVVTVKAKAVAKPVPKPILSPLTGIPVTAEQRDLPVIGVMIENSPDARPQSGLKHAGVVYEAIAEAGITRFLALFQEDQAANVGPVRSSRPYYLDWAMAFDASYAHVGGSPDALQRIKDIHVRDIDQFFNPAAYHRITTRYAPHNVYTSIGQLTDLAKSKGYEKSTFTSFERKAEKPYVAPAAAPAASTPAAGTAPANKPKPTTKAKTATETRTPANAIDLGISGAYYNAHYDYDAATNTYKRTMAGAPHLDFDSKTQLAPKVVIALAMPYGLMADGYHSQYTTIGSGKMYVFQDGTIVTGTWTKGEPSSQFVFKDDAGAVLALNPGQTWISVVGDAAKVTYK